MRICVYSDVHWCENSSIVRSKGQKYSSRLENLIESVNWAEQLAWYQHCDCVICCGDFFDAAILNAQEVSALQDISWAPMSHLFLTGNHETNVSSLDYSTTDLFKLCPNITVVNTPQQYFIDDTTELCFLPYILERNRHILSDYFGKQTAKRIIFSHNDLKNVQYGNFLSTEGFEVDDIEANCDLYFNGHIHHSAPVTDKIYNIGNLTGQNFTEDATKYSHCAIVVDTDTLEFKVYQNPYALKFYKLDLTSCSTDEDIHRHLASLNYNGVATVHVNEQDVELTRALLETMKIDHIAEYRIVVNRDQKTNDTPTITMSSSDHLKQFEEYVLSNIGDSNIVREELVTIMR